jgi:hypothetical protein
MAPAPDATSAFHRTTSRPTCLPAMPWLQVPFRSAALATHDGDTPPADPAPPADPPADPAPSGDPAPPADPPADPADDKPLGTAGEKALREWKERARKAELEAKANRDAAARLKAIEDQQKSEAERLAEAAEQAKARAAAAEQRAVSAEIRARASSAFADPTDAVLALGSDMSRFVDDAGVIDEAAIQDALDGLLDARPHWRKASPAPAAPAAPPAPRPDPSQGSRPPAPPVDYLTAPDEDFRAEARRLGVRLP